MSSPQKLMSLLFRTQNVTVGTSDSGETAACFALSELRTVHIAVRAVLGAVVELAPFGERPASLSKMHLVEVLANEIAGAAVRSFEVFSAEPYVLRLIVLGNRFLVHDLFLSLQIVAI
jgi:hypothetical protein